jgi:uncharacterized protein DUF4382/carboxypeptidase family protein
MKCLRTLILAATLAAAACYQDDPLDGGRQNRTRVFLTDAPFPFDSVGSVNIYIVRIEATTSLDTSAGAGTEPWQTIAEPHRAFDLLALQQGLTAAIGEGLLSAGTYRAVRLIINVDSSSIKWLNGTDAQVDWRNFTGPELRLYALVESPVDVPQEGVDLVIDFDLGRSFLYNLYGTHEFTLQHWLRAVNAAATGAIAGTVTSDYTGTTQPIRNANVAVYDVHFFSPYLVATGHTDAQGYFKIAFLPPGTSYQLEIQQPNYPNLAPMVTGAVTVTAGGTTTVSVSLPEAGNGGAYIQITGPSTVGVGGTIALRVAVGDSTGNPISPPVFTAFTPDTGLVALVDSSYPDLVFVNGRAPGQARVIASSNGLSDTAVVQVVGALMPVDSVFVRPVTATFTVGDSAGFYAELYDSTGAALSYHPVSWFLLGDSSVLQTQAFGQSLLVRARKAGNVTVRAWSGEKFADASVTVIP